MQIFVSCAENLGKPQVGNIAIDDKAFSLYLTARQIQAEVKRMASRMNKDLMGHEVLFLVILNGAFMFTADLLRWIQFKVQVSFIKIASYEGISSTGKIKALVGLEEELEGKIVVVIEDIIDTGLTMVSILDHLKRLSPMQVKIAALFFKPGSYKKSVEPDYIGFRIPNRFVAGYGLDYNGFGRNLRDLYMLEDG